MKLQVTHKHTGLNARIPVFELHGKGRLIEVDNRLVDLYGQIEADTIKVGPYLLRIVDFDPASAQYICILRTRNPLIYWYYRTKTSQTLRVINYRILLTLFIWRIIKTESYYNLKWSDLWRNTHR